MEKLLMCRVCLAQNVRMYVVVNKNLRDFYEKLSDNPFVTEDSRPILTCFFCCTKLKQCYQFQRKCLEAKELFARMMNEGYEPNPLINQDHPKFCNGFIQSPIVHMNIVDECQTENVAIKEELPVICERLDDIIEPKKEHQSDELELNKQENRFSVVDDIPTLHHSESDYDTLTEFKIEVEEHEVSVKKIKVEDVIPEEQKKNQSDTKVIRTTENSIFKTVTKFKEPLTDTKRGVNYFSLDTNCRNKAEIKSENSKEVIVTDIINRHQRLCVKEKYFKCEICQRSFNRNYSLSKHIHVDTGGKPNKCEVCQHCYNKKYTLTKHNFIYTGEERFKCDVCQRVFRKKSSLIKHIRIHTGAKPLKCEYCHRSFNHKGALTIHIRTHTGEKPFKCDICQRRFTEKGTLTKHIGIHTGEKPLKCEFCHRSFNRKAALTVHIRTHTGEKPYKCDICQHRFNEKGTLTKHIRIHTGEKPFKCDVCQRCFCDKNNLTSHIRAHTGEKPFKCDVCHRSFNQKGHLTRHIRTHTGEKRFKCDICQHCFREKSHLTRHIRTHTGEKPYKCEVCHCRFSRKGALSIHISTHTGEKA